MNLRNQILEELCGNCEEVLEEGIFNQDANRYEIIIDGNSKEYKNQRVWLKELEGAEDEEHSVKGAQDSIKEILKDGGQTEVYLARLENGKRPKATAKVTLISSKRDIKQLKKAAAVVDNAKYKFSIKHNPNNATVEILMGNKSLVTLPNPIVARDAIKGVIAELNKLIERYYPKAPEAKSDAGSTTSADASTEAATEAPAAD